MILTGKRNWDKDDVVQKYNGILLSHKTECDNVICSNTERLKMITSEVSQRQIHDITYIRNLKKKRYK